MSKNVSVRTASSIMSISAESKWIYYDYECEYDYEWVRVWMGL